MQKNNIDWRLSEQSVSHMIRRVSNMRPVEFHSWDQHNFYHWISSIYHGISLISIQGSVYFPLWDQLIFHHGISPFSPQYAFSCLHAYRIIFPSVYTQWKGISLRDSSSPKIKISILNFNPEKIKRSNPEFHWTENLAANLLTSAVGHTHLLLWHLTLIQGLVLEERLYIRLFQIVHICLLLSSANKAWRSFCLTGLTDR